MKFSIFFCMSVNIYGLGRRPFGNETAERLKNEVFGRLDNITTCSAESVPLVFSYFAVCSDVICFPLEFCEVGTW